MSLPKHIQEHAKLGVLSFFGENAKAVGSGGDFPTLDAALDWAIAQTGWTQVTGTTGTVSTTQGSDVIDGSGTNFLDLVKEYDFVRVTGSGEDFYQPVMYASSVIDSDEMVMFNGSSESVSGAAWEIWRPNKISLILLEGEHVLSANKTLPNGIWLDMSGASLATVWKNTGTVNTGSLFYNPQNILTVSNMSIVAKYAPRLIDADASVTTANHSGIFRLDSIDYFGSSQLGTPIFNLKGASIRLRNINANNWWMSTNASMGADEIIIDGFNCRAVLDGSVSTEPMLGLQMYETDSDIAKPFVLKDVYIQCNADIAVQLLGSNSTAKKVSISNLTINNERAIAVPATETFRMEQSSVIDGHFSNMVVDGHLEFAGLAGDIKIKNSEVHIDEGTGTLNVIQLDAVRVMRTSTQADYQVGLTISPDANFAVRNNFLLSVDGGSAPQIYTISASGNPQAGQRLTFIFEQDATGGNTLVFNAVYRMPGGTPLVGAASEVGVYDFEYDGGEWILRNTPVWY